MGNATGDAITTGGSNTAIGKDALTAATTAVQNTCVGVDA